MFWISGPRASWCEGSRGCPCQATSTSKRQASRRVGGNRKKRARGHYPTKYFCQFWVRCGRGAHWGDVLAHEGFVITGRRWAVGARAKPAGTRSQNKLLVDKQQNSRLRPQTVTAAHVTKPTSARHYITPLAPNPLPREPTDCWRTPINKLWYHPNLLQICAGPESHRRSRGPCRVLRRATFSIPLNWMLTCDATKAPKSPCREHATQDACTLRWHAQARWLNADRTMPPHNHIPHRPQL